MTSRLMIAYYLKEKNLIISPNFFIKLICNDHLLLKVKDVLLLHVVINMSNTYLSVVKFSFYEINNKLYY